MKKLISRRQFLAAAGVAAAAGVLTACGGSSASTAGSAAGSSAGSAASGSTIKVVWPDGSAETVRITDPSSPLGVEPVPGTQQAPQ